jgi:hypothetical protein
MSKIHRPLLRGRFGQSLGAIALAAATALWPAAGALRAEGNSSVGIVSHVKVLSDHVEDVSSLEAWKKSFISEGMDEQAKAIAVWKSVVMFRHQNQPPKEFLNNEEDIHDPIKAFNVYGYGQCCCASSAVEQLARYAGLEARGWGITQHSVPEIKVNGHWGMYDGSLINYFKNPDGTVAGVEEINKSTLDWISQHPEYKGTKDHKVFYKIMGKGAWRQGPAVLAGSVSYNDNGWLPAGTHGWGDSMLEFGGPKNFVYEYAAAVGYEVNIQLRPGEKLIRNWSNKGLHVNQDLPKGNAPLGEGKEDKSQMAYMAKWGDLAPGRVGNGTFEYDLPLANGQFKGGMLSDDNLACTADDQAKPALHVKDASKPGELIFRMPSSYVYLSGELTYTAVVGSGGSIAVSFSDNNGLDWKEISNVTASGPQTVDLKPLVYRRYDYRLKFQLKGKGTGLDAVKVTHDIQHSQRPLPILDKGDNHITFSEGPQEGTITIEGNLSKDDGSGKGDKNLLFSSFHPVLEGLASKSLMIEGNSGTATVPIKTPGDMTRLRIGAGYRAGKEGWTIQASFDDGKTFVDIGKLEGPYKGMSKYMVFDKVPVGARSAQVRLTGQGKENFIMDLRIDADYKEPHGGLAPVKVTYVYTENGQDKTDVHVAKTADDAYTIHCDAKPEMKSITLEVAE